MDENNKKPTIRFTGLTYAVPKNNKKSTEN